MQAKYTLERSSFEMLSCQVYLMHVAGNDITTKITTCQILGRMSVSKTISSIDML